MAEIGGNQPGFGVTPVTVNTAVTTAHNNRILDVTAGSGDIDITLPAGTGIPNGVSVIIRRNAASTKDVIIGAPISKTLTSSVDTCEIICNGTTWLELSRGSSTATPTAHASSHASAGSDPISPSSIGAASTAHASTHADGGSDEVTPLAIGAPSLHGFVDRSATIAFNDGTRKLTITPSTTFDFWVNGTKFSKAAQEVTIDNTAGLHFCSESDAGALQKSMDPWDIEGLTATPASIVWWNGSSGRPWEERHGYRRSSLTWHKNQHTTQGARYESGLGLTLPTTGTPGDFQLESGYIWDEDLRITVGQQTQCIICYRTSAGAAMTFDSTPANVPYRMNGANLEYDSGAGGKVNAGSNNYINYWLYVTNDISVPAYVVLGQASHTTLAAARAEGRPTIPMSTAEWVLAYRLTYRNTGTPSFIEATDYRNVQSGPPVNYTAPASVAAQNVLVDATGYTGTLASKTTAQLALDALDKHAAAHHSGGTDALAHQSIAGSGTNTHAQIDSHVASTSNPHSVTAAQAGAYYPGGTDVAVGDGGTGKSSWAAGDIVYASATDTLAGLAATAPASGLLSVVGIGNGESAFSRKAIFDTTNPEALGTAGPGTQLVAARRDHVHPLPHPLAVANGGSGATTLASNGVLYGNGTSAIQALAVNSASQTKFLSQASSGAPAWNGIFSGAAMAKAYLASSTSAISTSTWVKVAHDATIWNTGSHYSTSDKKFTAPRAGKYLICAGVLLINNSGSAADIRLDIHIGDGTADRDALSRTWHRSVAYQAAYGGGGATVMDLALNEDVEVWVYTETANQLIYGGADNTWVSITELPT